MITFVFVIATRGLAGTAASVSRRSVLLRPSNKSTGSAVEQASYDQVHSLLQKLELQIGCFV